MITLSTSRNLRRLTDRQLAALSPQDLRIHLSHLETRRDYARPGTGDQSHSGQIARVQAELARR